VNILDRTICWISGDTIDQFKHDLQEVIDKYKI